MRKGGRKENIQANIRDWKELAASLSWIVQSPENRTEQNRLTYKLSLSLKQFL